ncbi:hypothetical protein ACQKMN_16245 [Ureibacillus composti]
MKLSRSWRPKLDYLGSNLGAAQQARKCLQNALVRRSQEQNRYREE